MLPGRLNSSAGRGRKLNRPYGLCSFSSRKRTHSLCIYIVSWQEDVCRLEISRREKKYTTTTFQVARCKLYIYHTQVCMYVSHQAVGTHAGRKIGFHFRFSTRRSCHTGSIFAAFWRNFFAPRDFIYLNSLFPSLNISHHSL